MSTAHSSLRTARSSAATSTLRGVKPIRPPCVHTARARGRLVQCQASERDTVFDDQVYYHASIEEGAGDLLVTSVGFFVPAQTLPLEPDTAVQ